jgi:anthranilate/para-aminobenzoate synthase component II
LKSGCGGITVDVANYAEIDWSCCTREWPLKYDGVVLGGFSITRDQDAAKNQCAALVGVTVPLLGICGGLQDICKGHAQAAGNCGTIMKRISEQPVNKYEHLEIPTLNIQGRMKYIRRWGVIPSALPSTLEILSLDAAGESVAAVRHKELPILGFQGHPEYSPDPVSTQCLITFFAMISQFKEAVHKTACDQLLSENATLHDTEAKQMISNQQADLPELLQLTGTDVANVRNVPQGKGQDSIVLTTLPRGSHIQVLKHLANDWVLIGAPAQLEGLCTRLRHGSGKRVWTRLEAPPLAA